MVRHERKHHGRLLNTYSLFHIQDFLQKISLHTIDTHIHSYQREMKTISKCKQKLHKHNHSYVEINTAIPQHNHPYVIHTQAAL